MTDDKQEERRILDVTEDEMWAIHTMRLQSSGKVHDIIHAWLSRNKWFFNDLPLTPSHTDAEHDALLARLNQALDDIENHGDMRNQRDALLWSVDKCQKERDALQQQFAEAKAKLDAVPKYVNRLLMKCPQCGSEEIQDVACEICDKARICDEEEIKKLTAEAERLKKWRPACFGVGPNAPCERNDHLLKECKDCPFRKRPAKEAPR